MLLIYTKKKRNIMEYIKTFEGFFGHLSFNTLKNNLVKTLISNFDKLDVTLKRHLYVLKYKNITLSFFICFKI